MENWGLITYRERNLLFDPSTDSLQRKKRIAMVIAHELAHQWVNTVLISNKKICQLYNLCNLFNSNVNQVREFSHTLLVE